MAGRTRRVRVIVFIVFAALAFFLYTRRSTPVDSFREYYKQNSIGGGAVIRPPGEKEADDAPAGPEPKPAAELTSTPPPVVVHHSWTTTSVETTTSTATTSSANPSLGAPTPAPVVPPPVDHDLPYQVGEGRVEVPIEPSHTRSVEHWIKQAEHFLVTSTIQLPTGTSIPLPRIQRAVNKLTTNGADKDRRAIVKGAAEHAWKGYKDFAWGMDEVRPLSGRQNNPFNGWGATLVDSLDTLWLMGMKTEFEEAVEAVKKIDFTTSPRPDIPVFETVIRYLGGLIAAYDVSGQKYRPLLDKAVELAEVLFSIFDTPNRMPLTFYRWKPAFSSQPHRSGNRVILAEIGTLSLEFTRLAQLTKEPKYYDAIARITDEFEKWQNNTRLPGMWPTSLDSSGCGKPVVQPERILHPDGSANEIAAGEAVRAGEGVTSDKTSNDPSLTNRKRQLEQVGGETKVTVHGGIRDEKHTSQEEKKQLEKLGGADVCVPQGLASVSKNTVETFTLSGASDSMYEYLPKEYIILGGQVDQYRTMYLDSAKTFIDNIVFKPMTKDERDILLTGEVKMSPNYSQPIDEREYTKTFKAEAAHLACFAGGMFALGGVLFDKPDQVEIGSKLTDGCVWAYNVTQTGIMPEGAEVIACDDTWGECPWDEKIWWKALDPYAASRLTVNSESNDNDFIATPPKPATKDDSLTPPDVPQVINPPSLNGPQPKVDLNKKADDFASRKNRRQLEGDVAVAAPPQPASMPKVWDGDDNFDLYGQDDSTYEPEKPLSHEEFVKKKIEEERLPPGYTRINFRKYILRPEAIESVFYMYRITGDQYWRDVGWNMFTSIDKYTKAPHGYSAIDDITRMAPDPLDQMESFWLAETLKYFYLLYDDPDTWSLDDWVLNTEAHLFKSPEHKFTADF